MWITRAQIFRKIVKIHLLNSLHRKSFYVNITSVNKKYTTSSAEATKKLAKQIGSRLKGGEVIVFSSDLGGGKTTFVRGLAEGFGSADHVASPTFTINAVYGRDDGKQISHFDFYRLDDPGIIKAELEEVIVDEETIVVVEWGKIVKNVLPEDSVEVTIHSVSDEGREFSFKIPESRSYLIDEVKA